jgi:homoserine kinase
VSAPRVACATAPASVGNVSVGFDILGHTLAGACDRVHVRRTDVPEVRIEAIRGNSTALPFEAKRNTAGAALLSLHRALRLPFGFAVEIDKGIPFGSGMGGSAASCVAALVAANALLDAPLPRAALYPFALDGEAVASGGRHGDNVGPMLLGGLVLATADRLERIPVPSGLHCALAHPHVVVETRRAREVLQGAYAIGDFVAQSAHLARLLAACFRGDIEALRGALDDVLVEPRRAALIAGFAAVKRAAMDAGALGAGISGAGPSMFAWCAGGDEATAVAEAMRHAFLDAGVEADTLVSPVDGPAAELVA